MDKNHSPRFRLVLLALVPLLLGRCLSPAATTAVVAWGNGPSVPPDFTNAVAIAAGASHNLVLRMDGTVAVWGSGPGTNVPPDLTNALAVAAGTGFGLALREDRTVAAWGFVEIVAPSDLADVVAISAGQYHAAALKRNGTVVCWGSNTYGQTNVPPGLTNVVEISAGLRWTLARLRNGDLIAWGLNGTAPTIVPAGTSNVVAMASGGVVTLALNDNGTVVAGGPGATGANTVPPSATNIVFVAAGSAHSLTIRNDGTPLVWGENSYGQTNLPPGLTNVVAMCGAFSHSLALTGELAPSFWRAPATDTAISKGRTLALFAGVIGLSPLTFQWQFNGTNLAGANEAWLFLDEMQTNQSGLYSVVVSNGYGSVSSESEVSVVEAPPSAILSPEAQTLPGLGTATLRVEVAGSLPVAYQWLRNGQPVEGATNASLTISNATTLDAGIYSVRVVNSFGAAFSSVARVQVSSLVAWGENNQGQLSLPTNTEDIVAIASGFSGSLFLRRDGTVSTTHTNMVPGLSNVAAIASGEFHALALLSNGTVVAWGGQGGATNIPAGLSNVMAVAGGFDHSLALVSNGTVVAWSSRASAQPPAGLSNVIAIAAGHDHALALREDGTVARWGSLGTYVPNDLTDVVSVAGGYHHSVALKQDGTEVAWTANAALGVPASVTNVTVISLRDYHTLALRSDRTVVVWGYPEGGNTVVITNVPSGLKNVASIAAGTSHSVALMYPADYRPFLTQTRAGETLSLTWPTELGKTYVIENSATLSPPDWAIGWSLPGNGTHLNVTTNLLGTGGFFRVRVE